MLEEREKQSLRSAMIEERSHFCTLFTLFKPVMVNRYFFKIEFFYANYSSLLGSGSFTCI
jgi:hypothetical protein